MALMVGRRPGSSIGWGGLAPCVLALDTYALIDAELIAVKAINVVAGTVTVDRGVLDTVPMKHVAGARIYFVEGS